MILMMLKLETRWTNSLQLTWICYSFSWSTSSCLWSQRKIFDHIDAIIIE